MEFGNILARYKDFGTPITEYEPCYYRLKLTGKMQEECYATGEDGSGPLSCSFSLTNLTLEQECKCSPMTCGLGASEDGKANISTTLPGQSHRFTVCVVFQVGPCTEKCVGYKKERMGAFKTGPTDGSCSVGLSLANQGCENRLLSGVESHWQGLGLMQCPPISI